MSKQQEESERAAKEWLAEFDLVLVDVMKLSPVPESIFKAREILVIKLQRLFSDARFEATSAERERLSKVVAALFR